MHLHCTSLVWRVNSRKHSLLTPRSGGLSPRASRKLYRERTNARELAGVARERVTLTQSEFHLRLRALRRNELEFIAARGVCPAVHACRLR